MKEEKKITSQFDNDPIAKLKSREVRPSEHKKMLENVKKVKTESTSIKCKSDDEPGEIKTKNLIRTKN